MRKIILAKLSLAFLAIFTFCSCRTDPFAEQEPYSNTSKFQLISKRISLNEAKHKSIVLPELAKAKKGIETISTAHVNGKVISYGNGISIDTDDVIYIENGPNYHTYTFRIQRENAPQDAPIENLVLSPLPDGSYREILLQYTLTPAERQTLQYGGFVDMKNKSTVTILSGSSYQTGIFSKGQACIDITETYYTTCSENVHSHGETSPTCTASIKSIAYTVIKTLCYSDNGPATENPVDPANPNGGGSSGSGSSSDYECTDIPTDPTDLGLTNEEGCSLAIPSLPNLPNPKDDPCSKIITENNKAKEFYDKTKFQGRLTEVKTNIATNPQEKSFSLGTKNGGEEVTSVITGTSGESVGIIVQSSDPDFNIQGGVHTHTPGTENEVSPPSFADVYAFLTANGSNSNFKYYYTITHNGNEYVFTITNPTTFASFLNNYPPDEYMDNETHGWNEEKDIGRDANNVKRYFEKKQNKTIDESYEMALAYILTKYNSGIGFSKKDSNGNFNPIFVKELPDSTNPQIITYQKTDDCNLK